jgi:hypothetical protein
MVNPLEPSYAPGFRPSYADDTVGGTCYWNRYRRQRYDCPLAIHSGIGRQRTIRVTAAVAMR